MARRNRIEAPLCSRLGWLMRLVDGAILSVFPRRQSGELTGDLCCATAGAGAKIVSGSIAIFEILGDEVGRHLQHEVDVSPRNIVSTPDAIAEIARKPDRQIICGRWRCRKTIDLPDWLNKPHSPGSLVLSLPRTERLGRAP